MIIDFHCHIFLWEGITEEQLALPAKRLARIAAANGLQQSTEHIVTGLVPLTRDPSEKLITTMNDANIDISVCFPSDSLSAEGLDDDAILIRNKRCAELARRYPGRIIPFAGIDPRRPKAPEMLRSCVEEFDMKGIKLHPDQGYSLVSEEVYKILEVAQECNIVFVTHTGVAPPPRRNRFAHPELLDDIGCDFPNLKIVAAHAGGSWHREWCAIATFNDNIFGDLAEWQLDAVGRYPRFCHELRELLDTVGLNKLLFSTDWPCFETFVTAKDWVNIIRRLPKDAPPEIQFTTEEVDAILGRNAQRILGI